MAPSLANTAILIGASMFLTPLSAKSPEDFVEPTAQSPAASKPAASAPAAPAKTGSPAPAKPEPSGGKPTGSRTPDAGAGKEKAGGSGAKAANAGAERKIASAGPAMDTAKIHSIYLEGDFDQAIRMLESALKNKKKSLTLADSVFIFKHLGVMYAATPATREKGRYYMHQLISIEPTAKILDMYASDTIYLIFRNAQEEFAARQKKAAGGPVPDSAAVPAAPAQVAAPVSPEPAGQAPVPAAKPRQSRTGYWVAGGAVLALGTAGILFILLDDPEPKRHAIVLAD